MNKLWILGVVFVNYLGCGPSLQTENTSIIRIERSNYWSKLSTFEGIYLRDSGSEYESSIPFQLTQEEQRRILKIVDSVNFWQIPDDSIRYVESLKQPDGLGAPTKHPDSGPTKLRIKTATHDKTITWIWYENYDLSNMQYILAAIDRILVERPEYKTMPRGPQRW